MQVNVQYIKLERPIRNGDELIMQFEIGHYIHLIMA